jgi:hypothetical protein
VGYTCSELIAIHEAEGQQEIPSQIFDAEGHKNIFQIRFNQGGDTTSFILDKVFNKKIPSLGDQRGTPVIEMQDPGTKFLRY